MVVAVEGEQANEYEELEQSLLLIESRCHCYSVSVSLLDLRGIHPTHHSRVKYAQPKQTLSCVMVELVYF